MVTSKDQCKNIESNFPDNNHNATGEYPITILSY